MNQLRCAIYARFSSDRQSPTSITDQVRKCQEYAARQGWTILPEHIYSDEAICGASTERDGLQRILAAATSAARPFDCILIDDTSRLTRKLADALNLYEKLTFAGVRLVAVSQGVDSESAQAELLIGVHGLIDAVYWRELAQKTHRGMQGRAIGGLATGGRCFGYRSIKGPDDTVRLEIEPSEAATVRRIFDMYSDGKSLKRIAWELYGTRSAKCACLEPAGASIARVQNPNGSRQRRRTCESSLTNFGPRSRNALVWFENSGNAKVAGQD